MKTVLVLSSCDAWHSHGSLRKVGIFSTMKALVSYLKKNDKLSDWDYGQLCSIGQTQCRDMNYCVEKLDVKSKC